MRTSITASSAFAILLFLVGCQSQPGSYGTSTDKEIEYNYDDPVQEPSAFVQAVHECLFDVVMTESPTDENRRAAFACIAEQNAGTVTRLEKGLADLDDMRQLAEQEDYAYLGPDVPPGSARAILDKAATAGNNACESLLGFDESSKVLKCQIIVQAGIAYQLATTLFEDQASADKLIPESPRPAIKGCSDARTEADENALSTADMLQASFNWRDCVRQVNEDTIYNNQVGDDSAHPGAQNHWQFIQSELNSITEETGQFCDLMVAVSDSPEGSISQLYRAGCAADVETFVALAIDIVRDPGTAASATE